MDFPSTSPFSLVQFRPNIDLTFLPSARFMYIGGKSIFFVNPMEKMFALLNVIQKLKTENWF